MRRQLKEKFFNAENLLHSNEVELEYHYGALGYLKMFLGGTPIPEHIEVYRKKDHALIWDIKDQELCDELADD